MTDQITSLLPLVGWEMKLSLAINHSQNIKMYNFDREQTSLLRYQLLPRLETRGYQSGEKFRRQSLSMQSKLHNCISIMNPVRTTVMLCHNLLSFIEIEPKTAQRYILRRIEFIWVPSNSQDCSKEYYCIVLYPRSELIVSLEWFIKTAQWESYPGLAARYPATE